MDSKVIANGILRALGIILAIVLILFFLYKIQSVITYIVIAGVTSLVGRPIVIFLRKRLKFGNTAAVIVTMLILVGLLVGLIGMFIPLIVKQSHNLALLDIKKLEDNIESLYIQVIDYFHIYNINMEESFKYSNLIEKLDFAAIPNFINAIIGGFGSFGIGLFSVLFISFFFLKDSKLLENSILSFIPDSKETRLKKSFDKIKDLLSRYFIGLIIQISILFFIYTIGLLIVGVENAVVIAFLCALINLIPYIGPLIGAVIMVTLSMTSNLGGGLSTVILPTTFYVLIVVAVGQLIDNFISQPFIFSKSVKSHPLEIFLVIIIAGILFGVVGMVVAVPAYTALKVILKEFLYDIKLVQRLTKDL
ncbi:MULTISPECIES: AI-2E family transporter [Mangrovimonas]|uniref:AI-2E family transporter n=1 Tax=Mangrovimonas TaxID=1211036 RepID=UPI0006B493FB|nr:MULTISPECIES: AI-2E family transporter [Mangrovimonas]OMP30807.1 AI-2E family transporter [Mangrovimonas sp. DI 80]